MSNQQSINDILTTALHEVRQQYGLAPHTIRVKWLGTVGCPAIAVTSIEIEGSVNDTHEQEEA